MEYITNVKLKDLTQLPTEEIMQTITALSHLKGVPTARRIFDLRLRDVQDIKDHMSEGRLENLVEAVKIAEGTDDVLNLKIVTFFGLVADVKNQITEIVQAEETALTSNVPNFKWEAVGGADKMSRFGIYNTLESLSGGDITKWEAILDAPFADVFTKLYMNRVKGELEHEMNTMKTTK